MKRTELKPRSVARAIPSLDTVEGGGVEIHRAFPIPRLADVDPFLLLDHMGPIDYKPGQDTGFPEHPHRGFETVTYLLSGQFEHRDSFGNHGFLEPGDVQWMTAGSGLVHSEMPGRDLVRKGGRLEGFQIWINLPRRDKMTAPRYQELKSAGIPAATNQTGDVHVKVIAGDSHGKRGLIESRTPILYLHLTLQPGAQHRQTVPSEFNAFAYIIRGQARLEEGGQLEGENRLILFAHDGEEVTISNPADKPLDLLLLAGEPIGEPIERYGPFVMNTRDEILQAFRDFRSGKMGVLS